jgi:NPCBM-associated, NEW3 domain of alpha-galactosidase
MKSKSILAVLALVLIANAAFAANGSVTAASGGTNLSANLAANGSAPAYTALGNLSIDEGNGGNRADITPSQTNATVVLSAPAGWQFQAGQGSASETGSSVTIGGIAVTASTITVTFSTNAATNSQDQIIVSGIRARAQNAIITSSPAGNITRTGGSATFSNFDGSNLSTSNFGSLSQTAAAANKLVIGTNVPPAGTAGVAFSPSPTVAIQDTYGNPRSADTTSISAARNTGSGTVALSGTTSVAAVAGVATFSNLRYAKAGETIQVDFSAAGLAGATSTAIAISAGPTSTFLITVPASTTAGSAFSITVQAKDSAGNDTPSYAGTVQFSSSDGQAVLPPNSTLPGGSATFNGVILKSAGSRTITATDTVSGAITGASAGITVNADVASQFAVTAPANTSAGTAFSVTVTAKDAHGNNAAYTGVIAFSSSDVQATLPSSYTFVAGDNGSHTFTNGVTLRTSGTQTVVATDTVVAARTGSANVNVGPGDADALAFFTQPGNATAGSAFGTQPVIKTVDAFGNVTTANIGNSKQVAITIQSGTGTLQGTTSINIGDNGPTPGTATFTNLRIDAAGAKVLRASNNTFGTVDSGSFTVAAGNATALAFTTEPGGATAGAAFTTQPVVRARDGFGNDTSAGLGGSKIVTIALQSGTGSLQGTDTIDIAGTGGIAAFTNLRIDATGSKTLRASASGLGNIDSGAFLVAAGAPSAIVKLAGDGQTAAAGSTLATDPSVRIEDAFGNAVQGIGVSFTPTAGSGSVTGGAQTTGATGTATVTSWTLGAVAGTHTLDATAGALSTSFTATSTCTYTTKASGNWNSPSTWVGECVPGLGNAVTIANGHSVTVTADAQAGSLTFVANTISSAVNLNDGVTLTVNGALVIAAPLNANVESVVNVGNATFNAGDLQLSGAGNRKAILQIANGTVNVAGNATFPGNPPTQQINITGAGSFNIQGNFAAGGTVDGGPTAVVRFNGTGAQTLGDYNPGKSFPNVEIASNVTLLGGLTVDHTLTINSGKSLAMSSSNLHLRGDFNVNGTFTANATVLVDGAQPQTFGGLAPSIDFASLTMSNAAGLTILKPISVLGTLTLTSGNISTGAHSVTILGNGGVARTSGHVVGNLHKVFTAAVAKTFEVGTANGYSPVDVSPIGGTYPTTFTATAIQGPHPSSPSASALQRYWTLNSGAITSADLTFSYLAGDVAGNESLYALGRYLGGWTYPAATVDTLLHKATVTNTGAVGGDYHLHTIATGLKVVSVNGGSSPVAGAPFDIVVQSVDAAGNPANVSVNTTIALTVQTGSALLGGTTVGMILPGANSFTYTPLTYTKAESGIVVRASTSGGQVLTFDDSDPFTVVPGPTSRFLVAAPANTIAGNALDVTVTAVDAHDNVTPSFAGTVAFASNDSIAVLPASYAFTGGDAGVHTFTGGVTLKTAGTRSITANSGAITGSANVAVDPASPDHLTLSAPASVTAGAPFTITVGAFDAFGNPTPQFLGTVSFATSDPGAATIPAPYAFSQGDNGSHTFTNLFALVTAGSRTITATSNEPAINGNVTITVDPAALDHFLVEAAGGGNLAPQTAGAPFSIRVTAQDVFQNTVTAFNGTVQITSNGTLTGAPLTSAAFTGGVLASQPLTITSAQTGTTVSVNEPVSGRNGTSNSFTVNPAGTASFLIEAGSGGTIAPQSAGVPFAIRITARDAFGNTSAAFTGTLDLTSNAGTVGPLTVTFAPADNGVKTINVTLTIANAAATITATHTPGGNSGTSNAFALNAANPNAFLVEAGGSGPIAPQTAGVPFSIRVTARDGFGNTATGFTGTVNLSANAGTIAPPSVTFTGADAGVKMISVTLSTSGTGRTITAAHVNGSGTSNPFTVNAGPVAHFRVEAAAGGNIGAQTAGVPFAIQVTALDAHDNVVPSFNGAGNAVVVTSTGTLLAGGGTTASFVNGILASHSVTIANGGSFTITATRSAGGSQSGTSNSFTVTGGADLTIAIAGPASMTPGFAAPFLVTVSNAGTSGAPDATVALTLPSAWTIAPPPAPLGPLAAGASQTLTFAITAPAGTAPSAYTLGASVATTGLELNTSNNTASATTRVGVLACPTGIASMQPDSTSGVSGDLTWQSANADAYEVYLGPAGTGCTTFAGLAADTRFAYSGLESGKTYEWRIVANRSGCVPVASACVKFTASCPVPRISGIPETASRAAYHVRWIALDGIRQYDVQESTSPDFANATTTSTAATQMPFRHTVTTATPFYYRVRPSGGCTNAWSLTLRVVVHPPQSPNDPEFEVVVEHGSSDSLTQDIRVDAPPGIGALEAAYTATTDAPWIVIAPAAGTLGSGGMNLTITLNSANLPIGSSTGTVTVKSVTGTTLGTWPVSMHAMLPVEEIGKTATPIERSIIAGAAHAEGVGSTWRSDIRVLNPSSKAAQYELYFTPSRTDGTKSGRRVNVEVGPGTTLALGDVVRRTFGYGSLAGESATGAIEIRPVGMSAISLTTSRTYNVTSDGTYGQYMPSTSSKEFATSGTTLSLQQVAQSKAYRTNLGLVEGTGSGATVRVRIFDANGEQLAEVPVVLAPFEQRQIDSVLAASNVSADDARIEVSVTSAAGSVAAYASVVDNATNDSLLVPGIAPAAISASRYVVPGIADFTTARNTWRSDLRIYNAGAASVTAMVLLDDRMARNVTIAPGQVKAWDGVLRSLFDVRDTGGAIHVVTSSPSSLIVTARTYDQRNGGTYGQFIPAMLPSDATSLGAQPLELIHVDQSARYRANIGVAETTGQSATVQLTVTTADGRTAQTTVELAPYEFRQFGSLLTTLGLAEATNARVTVRVTGGNGRVVAYASVVDNRTQDPTYVPGRR